MNTEVTKRAVPNLKGSIKRIPTIDKTLTRENCCADAKVVGDKFVEHSMRIDDIDPHFAENVGYNNTDSGLNATDVQGAIDEVNSEVKASAKRAEKIVTGELDTTYNIDVTKYRFIYYELRTSGDLCMISNLIPTAMLTAVVQEFNHTEYATANYNAEITVQIKQTSVKAYKKSLVGWNLSAFNVYGIY